MTGYYARPASPLGRWSSFLARLSAMMLLISGLSHRYGLMDTIGFFWVLGAIFFLAFAALVLSFLALQRLWDVGARGGRPAAFALILSALVLAPYAVSAWRAVTKPVLNDISTDIEDPPSYFLAAGLRRGSQNAIAAPSPDQLEIQRQAYPDVTGRRYDAAPDRVMTAITNVVTANGWPVKSRSGVIGEGDDVSLELRAWSPVFAFPADVVIRISDESETTYVDMRSSSLYAAHDLGDNARRIAAFMKALDAEMLLLAGT
ncbi:MAG: DUF1499 domain-containing protein [Brucellaceae bacterium]|nr:DUF1499 domain-containing protein [Brucellaceae bacterium]